MTICPVLQDNSILNALFYDYRNIQLTPEEIKKSRWSGNKTLFSKSGVYCNIILKNTRGYNFKSNTGIMYLVNIPNSYGMGLKIGNESIVMHNSFVIPDFTYPFPFCTKKPAIYIGKALSIQPYNLYNIRFIYELFKDTFKNTTLNRQNAINPNILFNNKTNYDVISFMPSTIDNIELYPVSEPNSIYNNQITEYLINKELISDNCHEFKLGTILIDGNKAAKVYATTNFRQDDNDNYAFTHNFHRDTVNDNFYLKTKTDIQKYQYWIVFRRIITMIIALISDTIILFINGLSMNKLLNYISDIFLRFIAILYFLYRINEYLFPRIHKDIASQRSFITDYSLIEENNILKPKQLSYQTVIFGYITTVKTGLYNTWDNLKNPSTDIKKMSVGEFYRYWFLGLAKNNENYTEFNFGKDYIHICNFYKDSENDNLLHSLNNSDLIIKSNYDKTSLTDNIYSNSLTYVYNSWVVHLGYGHLFFSILLSNANIIDKSIFRSLLNNLSGDIIPITFGHGVIDVIDRKSFSPLTDELCVKFLSKKFILKLMETNYEDKFYNLSNKIGNQYTFMYDAYMIIKNTINNTISDDDINTLNKSFLYKDNMDWKKAYTNAIFFGTVIHNIAHYIGSNEIGRNLFYKIIFKGLKNQITANKTKYINCSLIQKEMISKLKEKHPNYIDTYGYIFITPHA
jgi:hypothetical protein